MWGSVETGAGQQRREKTVSIHIYRADVELLGSVVPTNVYESDPAQIAATTSRVTKHTSPPRVPGDTAHIRESSSQESLGDGQRDRLCALNRVANDVAC